MAILDFKQIKEHAGARPAHVDVKVEAWGGNVRLQRMGAAAAWRWAGNTRRGEERAGLSGQG